MFLDSISGDIYNFDQNTLEWKPFGNVGLHYDKSIEQI